MNQEPRAIKSYVSYQHAKGLNSLTVGPSGFLVSETHPFLGASPDGTVYDSTDVQHPFGFIEVKCPYLHRNRTPREACSSPGFCCVCSNGSEIPKLRRDHAQVQGQTGVGVRPWCDFVIYTCKGISVERILFDEDYWLNKLLPKLESFFDNCLGPEIVSPLHALGLPIRNLMQSQ